MNELKSCEQEFWAAKQHVLRLMRKLATLKGWRASLAHDAADEALEAMCGQAMWEAFHLPGMPPNFKHWRNRDNELL
jgi:hypothetical protein